MTTKLQHDIVFPPAKVQVFEHVALESHAPLWPRLYAVFPR